MTQNSIWYAENIDLESLFLSHTSIEKEFLSKKKTIKKGDYVYLPEEPSDKIYFILDGKVKLGTYRDGDKEVVTAILTKGDVFGEGSILGNQKRKDFALAADVTELSILTQDEFNTLVNKNSSLSVLMMQIMGARVSEMEDRLESLVFKDSKTRILDFLIKSIEKKGQRIGYEWVLRNFITHQDIASLTSTSRQSVTMILNELRHDNIIQFDRKRLLVRDFDRLKSLVK
jgi:CRP/FNR family transcriptional regulator, cyclic AMP receptor protein